MKCQALIVKVHKNKKDASWWPEDVNGLAVHEECGGDITLKVIPSIDFCFNEDGQVLLNLDWDCSRCNNPWVPGRDDLDQGVLESNELDVTTILTGDK